MRTTILFLTMLFLFAQVATAGTASFAIEAVASTAVREALADTALTRMIGVAVGKSPKELKAMLGQSSEIDALAKILSNRRDLHPQLASALKPKVMKLSASEKSLDMVTKGADTKVSGKAKFKEKWNLKMEIGKRAVEKKLKVSTDFVNDFFSKVAHMNRSLPKPGLFGKGIRTCLREYESEAVVNLMKVVMSVTGSVKRPDKVFVKIAKGFQSRFGGSLKASEKRLCQLVAGVNKNGCNIFSRIFNIAKFCGNVI